MVSFVVVSWSLHVRLTALVWLQITSDGVFAGFVYCEVFGG